MPCHVASQVHSTHHDSALYTSFTASSNSSQFISNSTKGTHLERGPRRRGGTLGRCGRIWDERRRWKRCMRGQENMNAGFDTGWKAKAEKEEGRTRGMKKKYGSSCWWWQWWCCNGTDLFAKGKQKERKKNKRPFFFLRERKAYRRNTSFSFPVGLLREGVSSFVLPVIVVSHLHFILPILLITHMSVPRAYLHQNKRRRRRCKACQPEAAGPRCGTEPHS